MSTHLSASWAAAVNAVTANGSTVLAVGYYQADGQQPALILSCSGGKWVKLKNRDPLGKGLKYTFNAVSGGGCGSAWLVGAGFAAVTDQSPVAVHC